MNYEIKDEHVKHARDDDLQKKCYPKRANNQMPYQKIESELRKDAHWPPITKINSVNHINANNSNNPVAPHIHVNSIQNEKVLTANNSVVPSNHSTSSSQLNRSESNRKKHVKLDDTNFEMKITANDRLIYELDRNEIPIKMSPNLNDQFTKI
jgi:hypothetical protein